MTTNLLNDLTQHIQSCEDFLRDFNEALQYAKSPTRIDSLKKQIEYYQGKRDGLQYGYNALWATVKKENVA